TPLDQCGGRLFRVMDMREHSAEKLRLSGDSRADRSRIVARDAVAGPPGHGERDEIVEDVTVPVDEGILQVLVSARKKDAQHGVLLRCEVVEERAAGEARLLADVLDRE